MSTRADFIITAVCNLHPQRPDPACPRCRCAADVSYMNWSWTRPPAPGERAWEKELNRPDRL